VIITAAHELPKTWSSDQVPIVIDYNIAALSTVKTVRIFSDWAAKRPKDMEIMLFNPESFAKVVFEYPTGYNICGPTGDQQCDYPATPTSSYVVNICTADSNPIFCQPASTVRISVLSARNEVGQPNDNVIIQEVALTYEGQTTTTVPTGNVLLEMVNAGVNCGTLPDFTAQTAMHTVKLPNIEILKSGTNKPKIYGYQTGNNWIARFSARLSICTQGKYEMILGLGSADTAALIIDGVEVARSGCSWGAGLQATVDFSSGLHDVQVIYADDGWEDAIILSYSGADSCGVWRVVPAVAFVPTGFVDPCSWPVQCLTSTSTTELAGTTTTTTTTSSREDNFTGVTLVLVEETTSPTPSTTVNTITGVRQQVSSSSAPLPEATTSVPSLAATTSTTPTSTIPIAVISQILTPVVEATSTDASTKTTTTTKASADVEPGPVLKTQVMGSNSELVETEYVELTLLVQSVDYLKLMTNSTTLADFQLQVKEAIAHESGPAVTAEHVTLELSPGSVVVSATIDPPQEAAVIHEVHSKLSSSETLSTMVAQRVSTMKSVESISNGHISVAVHAVHVTKRLVTVATEELNKDPDTVTKSTTQSLSVKDFFNDQASGAQIMSRPLLEIAFILLWLHWTSVAVQN
jgi:hypothetical protein